MSVNLIEITVSGKTQTGKSAILGEIKRHLESCNMAVVYSDRSHRNNPPSDLDSAESHELPNFDGTVIVLSEINQQ